MTRRNPRNLSLAQRSAARRRPCLTPEDLELVRQGEDLQLDELRRLLRPRDLRTLLEQVKRLSRYRRWLRRAEVGFNGANGERCLFVMCLIMAIAGSRVNHIVITNAEN
jgi:hypothetical protein